MHNLPLSHEEVERVLRQVPGFESAKLKAFFDEKKKGRHFYKIRYAPGEIIMPRGVYSDYAALLLQGSVWAPDVEPESRAGPVSVPTCWQRPGPFSRWLKNWVRERTDSPEKPSQKGPKSKPGRDEVSWRSRMESYLAQKLRPFVVRPARERTLDDPLISGRAFAGSQAPGTPAVSFTTRDARSNELPLLDRFFGVLNVLWNQPRSFTLVAGDEERDGKRPCEMLLIKRKALLELIIEKSPQFYQSSLKAFFKYTLPRQLAENRLFRSSLSLEDVPEAGWSRLLSLLQEADGRSSSAPVRRLQELIDDRFRGLVADLSPEKLSPATKSRIISELNRLLQRRDFSRAVWLDPSLPAEALKLLQRDLASLMENEVVRLNRLFLEAALSGILAPSTEFRPLSGEDFRDLVQCIQAVSNQSLQLLRFETGQVVFDRGDPADGLYLIMSGTLRVTREVPGGRMLVLHLERNGYFGESCIEEGARRRSRVEALTSVNLLRLERPVVLELVQRYPAIGEKLRHEKGRTRDRDRDLQTGQRTPPSTPPQEIATRLIRTTNLLLIDMDLCTRCDQCVHACAEAHEGQPRFHRSNPDLRFGKWEVAAACVHCTDAPCQEACPVGAITFLDNGAVQIHRHRCIGCADCVPACPFDVIDMYPPTSPEDAARATQKTVASKCDLCLTQQEDPPCVAACPYGAAQRGAPQDLFPEIKGWENSS